MSPALWQLGSIIFGILGYALIWLGLKILSNGRSAGRRTIFVVCLIALLAIVLAQQVADNNTYRAAPADRGGSGRAPIDRREPSLVYPACSKARASASKEGPPRYTKRQTG